MTFDRKITLISSEQKNGSQGKADRAVKNVYAKVSEPGVTAKYAPKQQDTSQSLPCICGGVNTAVSQSYRLTAGGITLKQPERPTATCI